MKQVTEKNEAAAKQFIETLNTDDWDTVRKVVAPNYVFHHPVGARTQKYTGASMYRIESDKIAEIWDARNTLSIMRQLSSEKSIPGSASERKVG